MSTKKRILFIANEMSPYLELTEFSEIVNRLAIKSNDSGFEVRCIMPRFGVINERRHRLHEVVRLSGINVSVDNDDYPLQIKVDPCQMPVCRFISWKMRTFLRGNIFFTMKRKSGLMTMGCVRFSFAKERWKRSRNSVGLRTSFIAVDG